MVFASGGDHDKASDYIKTHCAPGTVCYADVSFQELYEIRFIVIIASQMQKLKHEGDGTSSTELGFSLGQSSS